MREATWFGPACAGPRGKILMPQRSERSSSYDSDARLPQAAAVLAGLVAVFAAGVYLIVRGLW